MKHEHIWEYIGIWTDWGDDEYRAYRCECGAVLKQFEDGFETIQEPSRYEKKFKKRVDTCSLI